MFGINTTLISYKKDDQFDPNLTRKRIVLIWDKQKNLYLLQNSGKKYFIKQSEESTDHQNKMNNLISSLGVEDMYNPNSFSQVKLEEAQKPSLDPSPHNNPNSYNQNYNYGQ